MAHAGGDDGAADNATGVVVMVDDGAGGFFLKRAIAAAGSGAMFPYWHGVATPRSNAHHHSRNAKYRSISAGAHCNQARDSGSQG